MKKIAIVAVTLILVIVAGMQELADSGSQTIIADSYNYGEWECRQRPPRLGMWHRIPFRK